MSTLKVDTILKRTGTGTITVGQSGDTITIPTTLNATTLQQNGSTIPTSFGKVLQTVANNYTTVATIGASGRTDLFTQAITPTVASSKILVSFSVGMGNNATGVSAINLLRDIASGGYAELGQGSGASSHNAAAGGAYDADSNVLRQISYVYLDSPSYSVGNAITYKLQYYSNSSTNQYINRSNSNATSSTSNIVLMEIAA
tara:strand:+ start:512 stop:1114 length:603 start_codon:yes stop_codon:yes gene_type:complete